MAKPEDKVGLFVHVDGKTRELSVAELALSNNLAQAALVRVLIDKGVIEPEELESAMSEVKDERFRTLKQTDDDES
jgi:hypothetical protein